jgi:hypothetical protein
MNMAASAAPAQLLGGKSLGNGWFGRTIEVAAGRGGDKETLHAYLSSTPVGAGVVAWMADGRKVALTPLQRARLLARTERASDMVAKRIEVLRGAMPVNGRLARETFETEMRLAKTLRRVFGRRVLRLSTLRALPLARGADVQGLETDAGFFVLSSRCETPLDRFDFDARSAPLLVRHVLEGIACLQAARMLHADIKLDNMIYCASDRRFKLIDWGQTKTLDALVASYTGRRARPENIGSPMAYFAYGLGEAACAVYMTYHVVNFMGDTLRCADFDQLLLSCRASFLRKMAHLRALHDDERALRKIVAERYAASFDTFGFGMICAHVACRFLKDGEPVRERLLDLARRLTHYDATDFVQDAAVAGRRW